MRVVAEENSLSTVDLAKLISKVWFPPWCALLPLWMLKDPNNLEFGQIKVDRCWWLLTMLTSVDEENYGEKEEPCFFLRKILQPLRGSNNRGSIICLYEVNRRLSMKMLMKMEMNMMLIEMWKFVDADDDADADADTATTDADADANTWFWTFLSSPSWCWY